MKKNYFLQLLIKKTESQSIESVEAIIAEIDSLADQDLFATIAVLKEKIESADMTEKIEEARQLRETLKKTINRILEVRRKTKYKIKRFEEETTSGGKIYQHEREKIKALDGDLNPKEVLYSNRYNRIILCESPEGLVVVKMPSSELEIKTFQKFDRHDIPGVAKYYGSGPECLATEYIKGPLLSEACMGLNGWELKDDKIFHGDKLITTIEKVKQQLRETVVQIHAKTKVAGLDIKLSNVKISLEDGRAMLFDFDMAYGGVEEGHIDNLIQDLLTSPKETAGVLASKMEIRLENLVSPLVDVLMFIFDSILNPKDIKSNWEILVSDISDDLKFSNPVEEDYKMNFEKLKKADFRDIEELFDTNKAWGSYAGYARSLMFRPGHVRGWT